MRAIPEGKRCVVYVRGLSGPMVGVVYYPVQLNYYPELHDGKPVLRGRWQSFGYSGSSEILLQREGSNMVHVTLADVVAWNVHGSGR